MSTSLNDCCNDNEIQVFLPFQFDAKFQKMIWKHEFSKVLDKKV
jgi:hypothetical protein